MDKNEVWLGMLAPDVRVRWLRHAVDDSTTTDSRARARRPIVFYPAPGRATTRRETTTDARSLGRSYFGPSIPTAVTKGRRRSDAGHVVGSPQTHRPRHVRARSARLVPPPPDVNKQLARGAELCSSYWDGRSVGRLPFVNTLTSSRRRRAAGDGVSTPSSGGVGGGYRGLQTTQLI
ncbi:hypothetical protein VPH35_127177 [Triticum aestivum]